MASGDEESREMREIFQREEEQGHDGPAAATFTPGLWVIFYTRGVEFIVQGKVAVV